MSRGTMPTRRAIDLAVSCLTQVGIEKPTESQVSTLASYIIPSYEEGFRDALKTRRAEHASRILAGMMSNPTGIQRVYETMLLEEPDKEKARLLTMRDLAASAVQQVDFLYEKLTNERK